MSVEKNEVSCRFESIFDEYIDTSIDESHQDYRFIEEIMGLHAKQISELALLKHIEKKFSSKSYCPSHPLALKIFSMLQDFQQSPNKRKIQLQIDTLGKNSEPKDDFILLMLDDLQKKSGIKPYLVTLDPHAEPRKIIGSGFFQASAAPEPRELPQFERLYSDIIDILMHDESPTGRTLIIVRQVEHYLVLDYDRASKQCLVLDAANDERQFNLFRLKDKTHLIEKIIYVKPFELEAVPEKQIPAKRLGLQKDDYNCATYALDHLYVSAGHPTLHQILREKMLPAANLENVAFVYWSDFPIEFVRNAVSPTFISKYKEKHLAVDDNLFSEQGLERNIQKFSCVAAALLEAHDEASIDRLKCFKPEPVHGGFNFKI
jgi:hypothetical protein